VHHNINMLTVTASFRAAFVVAVNLPATSRTSACLALKTMPFNLNKKTSKIIEKTQHGTSVQKTRIRYLRFSNTDIERDNNNGCGIYTSGLTGEEATMVQTAVMETLQEYQISFDLPLHSVNLNFPVLPSGVYGATGRVALICGYLDVSDDHDLSEEFRLSISAKLDEFVQNGNLDQPILLSVNQDNEFFSENDVEQVLAGVVENEVSMWSLCEPVDVESAFEVLSPEKCTPIIHAKIDGALIDEKWDTSDIYVFDGLVDSKLTCALRKVMLGQDVKLPMEQFWNDIELGPDPERWERGGLDDVVQLDDDELGEVASDGDCWGLSVKAVEDICFNQHDAINQFEFTLSRLFPDFHVCRLPEAVLGECVSPLTANAATCVDKFSWHIDADPVLVPPSPWADVFGRYPNRAKGKPRFISCLVYVNDEWDADNHGAPTRFLDPPTGEEYIVYPKPGRVLIMDQDITHTVVAPEIAAGKRPRYSLVWKLILHPKEVDQDMSCLFREDELFPSTQLIGSAASSPNTEETSITAAPM